MTQLETESAFFEFKSSPVVSEDETKAQGVILSREVKELKDSQEMLTTQLLQLQRSLEQSEKGMKPVNRGSQTHLTLRSLKAASG